MLVPRRTPCPAKYPPGFYTSAAVVCYSAFVKPDFIRATCLSPRHVSETMCSQIYAFEPIPVIYDVLVRNLRNNSLKFGDSSSSVPRPVALRIALGAEHGYQEFTFFSDSPGESTRCDRGAWRHSGIPLTACWSENVKLTDDNMYPVCLS